MGTSQSTSSAVPFVGRILLAAIFLIGGFGKLMDPAGTQGYIASVGLPFPVLGYAAALVIELGGGALLLLGYRVRLVSLGLAAFSIVSALIFHHALGDQNQMFHFLKNFAMAGGLLQFVAFGAGTIGLDSRAAARA